ncbi:MAG: TIGR03960 family B12-binding radical SAM protein [Eubacteriales bacterium]
MKKDYKELLDDVLPFVESPGRYIGNEINSVHKEITPQMIRFAFAFPDLYEVGMSHLGMKILYHLLNEREDVYCERVFAPWIDLEKQMRDNDIPLFSIETKDPIRDFNFFAFTLQYEMSYSNILNMMDLAGIPPFSKDRGEQEPLIIVGGPCAYNCEPIADFIDIAIIGEGEEVILEIMDAYKSRRHLDKNTFLRSITDIQGVYIPSLYEVEYQDGGIMKEVHPVDYELPTVIKKRVIHNMDQAYFPEKIIVPFIQTVHDRIMLEVFRGCTRGCRFCQAGMLYRPIREKSVKRLMEDAEKLLKNTGYEEISLSSLSTTDYSQLQVLVDQLIDTYEGKRISVSLPSLRMDTFSIELAEKIQKVRKTGLTFAPEAGTQRLRDVINKGVTEEDLMQAVTKAFEAGWGHVKLYFMIGLPTETMEDIESIAILAEKVVGAFYKTKSSKKNRNIKVVVSTSSFVPKSFTPFQWEGQDTMEQINAKQNYLKKRLRHKKISYNWHEASLSMLEGVFARGDRRLANVLYKAWQKGCKFDGWRDLFLVDAWMEAFKENNLQPAFYCQRKRGVSEVLPWDIIQCGVTKEFLIEEKNRAYSEELSGDCRKGCSQCGITEFFEGWVCHDGN